MAVKPIPEGYHSITPYLVVKGAARLIEYLKQAFDAKELHRMSRPDGTIWHAELQIGDSRLMLGDATAQWQPLTGALNLYVEDVDLTYERAVEVGLESVMEPATHFYGDRSGGVKDPFGNFWWISTHVEDVPPEEVARRAAAAQKK